MPEVATNLSLQYRTADVDPRVGRDGLEALVAEIEVGPRGSFAGRGGDLGSVRMLKGVREPAVTESKLEIDPNLDSKSSYILASPRLAFSL